MARTHLVDIEMMIHVETDYSVRASIDGNDAHGVWLPKSRVEFKEKVRVGKAVVVTMTEFLAIEKGLV